MKSWNHENRTPVIIAAFNEEAYIGRTLSSLDKKSVYPVVVVNGSTDNTADIAREFTDQVIVMPEQGKMPALQQGVRSLGARGLQSILFLDADSVPRYPKKWADAMEESLDDKWPSVVAGRLRFIDGEGVSNVLRSYRRKKEFERAADNFDNTAVYGANMAMALHDDELLESFLDIKHVWPGEDKLIVDQIVAAGGMLSYAKTKHADVDTSSRHYPSITTRIIKGQEFARAQSQDFYGERAAAGVEGAYLDGVILPVKADI